MKSRKFPLRNVVVAEFLEVRRLLAAHTWTGANGPNWSDPQNWTGGAPNVGESAIVLDFPSEQRFEVYLRNSTEAILTIWSDNHAFEDKPGTVLINPLEQVDYPTTIATRDLSPNKVFIVEVFFPQYPELRIRQKFLTAP